MIALAWAAPVLVLAGCAAYAAAVLRASPLRAARYRLARLRYARRMRGPLPERDQGIAYDRRAWLAILDAWDAPAARTERSRA
jgi:hypothetical protein